MVFIVLTDRPAYAGGGLSVYTKFCTPSLVYDATTGRSWAHWQENREGERVSAPISYRELVRRTGVEFLPTAGR